MDNFEILIYVIFGIIYLISRAVKKKKPAPKRPRPTQDQEYEQENPTPVSFEDLLKELTGEQTKPKPQPQPQPQPQPIPQPQRQQTRPNPFKPSQYDGDDSEAKKVFEEARRRADEVRSIDDLVDLEESKSNERFDVFKIKSKSTKGDEIREMLKNTEDARKAVILAEILNRKF